MWHFDFAKLDMIVWSKVVYVIVVAIFDIYILFYQLCCVGKIAWCCDLDIGLISRDVCYVYFCRAGHVYIIGGVIILRQMRGQQWCKVEFLWCLCAVKFVVRLYFCHHFICFVSQCVGYCYGRGGLLVAVECCQHVVDDCGVDQWACGIMNQHVGCCVWHGCEVCHDAGFACGLVYYDTCCGCVTLQVGCQIIGMQYQHQMCYVWMVCKGLYRQCRDTVLAKVLLLLGNIFVCAGAVVCGDDDGGCGYGDFVIVLFGVRCCALWRNSFFCQAL